MHYKIKTKHFFFPLTTQERLVPVLVIRTLSENFVLGRVQKENIMVRSM